MTGAPGAVSTDALAETLDAPLFHGRRRLVESLVARLVDASIL